MAWIQTSPGVNSDLDTFNYGTEADKIKRRRAAAQALSDQAMKSEQGQYIKNGDYIGFTGGNTMASTAARLLAAYASKDALGTTDSMQGDLDKNSMAALAHQLDSKPWDQRARAEQAAANAMAEGDAIDARNDAAGVSQQAPTPEPAQTYPVSSPSIETRQLPSAQAASAALNAPQTNPSGMTPQQMEAAAMRSAAASAAGGQRRGSSGSLRRNAYVAGMDQPVPDAREAFVSPAAAAGGATGSWDAPAAPVQPLTAQQPPMPMQAPAAPAQVQQPAPPTPVPVPVPEANGKPTRAEMLTYIQKVAQTGPVGQQIAQAQLQDLFGGKNEYEVSPVKDKDTGDITAVLKWNKRTGAYSVDNLDSGQRTGSKIVGPETGADGKQYNRHKDGSLTLAVGPDGKPFVSAEGQKVQQGQEAAKASELGGLQQMKVQRDQLIDAIPILSEVGTGRLQTPWNNAKAYFTDSTKLDRLNRSFNAQQLQDAVTWLKGQGSVTEGERALLAKGGFDPKASTHANLDYANTVLSMLNKHIDVAEQAYSQKYGAEQAPPKAMYTWQKR